MSFMSPPAAPRPLCVLLIEDHADTASAIAKLLRNRSHRVLLADCCAAARTAAASAPLHVAVGDLGLPDGDGVELLADLKRSRGCATIAFTGHGMPEDIDRCKRASIDLHLLKPLHVDELIHAIETLGSRVESMRTQLSP
jgi:DNA-binding response OmpR family regulator